MPIPRAWEATSECLVIMAPITAPMDKMTDSVRPSMRMKRAGAADRSV